MTASLTKSATAARVRQVALRLLKQRVYTISYQPSAITYQENLSRATPDHKLEQLGSGHKLH